jgi:aminoglycoside phosphotransferase (APT) family kinase protein
MHPSPESVEQDIPLPPERDSTSPTPTAPKPESLRLTRSDLLRSLAECENTLREGSGLDMVDSATATIRFAQRYRTQVKNEDLEDEKRIRRDAVDILVILRRIAERDGTDVTTEEKEGVRQWCNEIRIRVEKDDERRRAMWERATQWMQGSWNGNEWGNSPIDLD